jgi:hypothetical protein
MHQITKHQKLQLRVATRFGTNPTLEHPVEACEALPSPHVPTQHAQVANASEIRVIVAHIAFEVSSEVEQRHRATPRCPVPSIQILNYAKASLMFNSLNRQGKFREHTFQIPVIHSDRSSY